MKFYSLIAVLLTATLFAADAGAARPRLRAKPRQPAPLGMCYTNAGVCFVAWIGSISKAQCASAGGGSWARYGGGCERLRF